MGARRRARTSSPPPRVERDDAAVLGITLEEERIREPEGARWGRAGIVDREHEIRAVGVPDHARLRVRRGSDRARGGPRTDGEPRLGEGAGARHDALRFGPRHLAVFVAIELGRVGEIT